MVCSNQISLVSLGRNLKILRTSRGTSQTDMAEALGLTRSSYAQYELGNRMPDARILYEIARMFSLEMELLFENDQSKFTSEIYSPLHSESNAKLLENYRTMSSFSKGRLVEYSENLLEWDRVKEINLRALEKKRNAE